MGQTNRVWYKSPVKLVRISPLIGFESDAEWPAGLPGKETAIKARKNTDMSVKVKVELHLQDKYVWKSYTSFRTKYSIYDYLSWNKR